MDVVVEWACGMDVHKDSITTCIITPTRKEVQTFSTKTKSLLEMIDYLKQMKCTYVAMESTGVYWKPVVNILEAEGLDFMVVNAQHMKAVPGRKTDVKDAEWIAKLLRHGLLKPSFIPNRSQRELRELVRYRRSVIEERTRQHNRIQKVLEGANIKLSSVVSDIMGVSSREMLDAIAQGEENLETLVSYARGPMKRKKEDLALALKGYITDHQRMMIKTILGHIDFLNQQIEQIDEEVERRLKPHQEDVDRLNSIPGIARRTAEQILTEVGTDVGNQFPNADHLCSWAGLVPGSNESAGKKRNAKTRKGNKYLRSALIEAAHSVRNSNNYLGALYRRHASRKGKKRAAVAVAHAILKIAYFLLTRKEMYVDLGVDYFDKRREQSIVTSSIRKLQKLGYIVSIQEIETSETS